LLPVSSEGEAGSDVFTSQFREIGDDVLLGHSGGEIVEHIRYCNAHAANARFAAALSGFNGDIRIVVPLLNVQEIKGRFKSLTQDLLDLISRNLGSRSWNSPGMLQGKIFHRCNFFPASASIIL
jgi:hypothetical protein